MKRNVTNRSHRSNGAPAKARPAAVVRLPPRATAQTLRAVTDEILREESDLRQGGGPAGQARQRKLGRLPVRERFDGLLDPGATFLEIGLWAAYGMYADVGGVPAAGVVTGVGRVEGRACMVIANDATVK